MVAHPEQEDVAVERRPVLLADHDQPVGRRHRMRTAARHEELVVEDAVVLVGDLLVDDVLVLGRRHQHQVLERVAQVAAVVHVDVGRAAVPAPGRHVGHAPEIDGDLRHLARADLHRDLLRPVLEPLDDGQLRPPGRHLHREAPRVVEEVVPLSADAGVGVRGGVEPAVGRGQVDAGGRRPAGRRVAGDDRQDAHRPLPAAARDGHGPQRAAVRLQQRELRQPALVGDERDPLVVRRPARVERVVAEEGELVGLAAGRGLHVEVVELVGGAAGRRIDEPPAVARHVGPRAVQRLLAQHRDGVVDAAGAGRHAQHVTRAERDVPVRDQEQLVPVRQPRRRQVHVPAAEVEPVAAEVVVARHRGGGAVPAAVRQRPDVHVEVAARAGRHVGDAGPVGREDGVGVDAVIVGERARLARRDVEDLELHGPSVVVRRIDDPAPVGRPVRGGMPGRAAGQLDGGAAGDVDAPDGAGHRHGDRPSVGRPRRRPRGRARRRRQVVVEHVVPAVARRRVAPGLRHRRRGRERHEQRREEEAGRRPEEQLVHARIVAARGRGESPACRGSRVERIADGGPRRQPEGGAAGAPAAEVLVELDSQADVSGCTST